MDKITQTSINSDLKSQSEAVAWWNRPVVGEGSILAEFFSRLNKQEVSESVVVLHNRELMDIRVFAKTAEAIDNEKFGTDEFLVFVKIQYLLRKGIGDYADLNRAIQLLQVAIKAKDSFITIDQTELRYRGSKQQQFYEHVQESLVSHTTPTVFREQVQEKLTELMPQVKTDEGKTALQSYAQHMDRLSEHELGLQLLSLFKTYELADYSILRIISDMIASLNKRDLKDAKSLISLVMVNLSVFEKLKKIIGISDSKSTPETYAIMIQYIALANRHRLSFMKFQELMKVIRKWNRPYQAIVGIRNEHPATEFKLPKEFLEPIPGFEVYQKYKNWLTDKRTGMTYVDFGEEVDATTTRS